MLSESPLPTSSQEHARLLKALRESELLRELSELLASSLDPSHILQVLVRRTTEVCEVERCAVWLLDNSKMLLLPSAYHYAARNSKRKTIQHADRMWRQAILPSDNPIFPRLQQEQGLLFLEDLRLEPSMQSIAKRFLVRSVLLIALIREDRLVGMMSLDNQEQFTTFSKDQQQLARAIGQQAAAAIDNARLYQQAQEERKRAERLIERVQSIYQVAMAVNSGDELPQIMEMAIHHLVHGLNAQNAAIAFLEKNVLTPANTTQIETTSKMTASITTLPHVLAAMKKGSPFFVAREQLELRERQWFQQLGMENVLIVPLMAESKGRPEQGLSKRAVLQTHRSIGFAFVSYLSAEQYPTHGQQAFAKDIAAQCALAIEKAHILVAAQQAVMLANERANMLDAVFNAMTEGIIVLDMEGKIIMSNDISTSFVGLTSNEKKRLSTYLQNNPAYTLAGQPIAQEDFPLVRALRGEKIRGERFINKLHNGVEQAIEINIAPLFDDDEQQIGIVSAFRDITEQVRVEQSIAIEQTRWQQEAEIARTNEATMRESNALKDEFLALTAHEFRTPLTVILTNSQMMERLLQKSSEMPSELSVRFNESITSIEEQTRQLVNIVNTFLEVTQLNRGQISLNREKIRLEDIVKETIATYSTTAPLHRIKYRIERNTLPYTLLGDRARLLQIFANLLQNAIKYSPRGGPITITMAQLRNDNGKRMIEVGVVDKGIGVPKDAQPYLFERFYRASNSKSNQTRGIGLGLYVVAEFLRLHDGTIRVESEGVVGKGTRFIITLPLQEN